MEFVQARRGTHPEHRLLIFDDRSDMVIADGVVTASVILIRGESTVGKIQAVQASLECAHPKTAAAILVESRDAFSTDTLLLGWAIDIVLERTSSPLEEIESAFCANPEVVALIDV